MKKILFLIILLPLLAACTTDLPFGNKAPKEDGACTTEALICPDGTAVGRTGPDCQFAPCPEASGGHSQVTLKVFFGNSNFNPNAADCSKVYARERIVPETKAVATAALKELFKGPTSQEKALGYYSFFSEDTADILKSVRIIDKTAYVDLKAETQTLIPDASASCGSAAFMAEMTNTLRQFPTIEKAVFALDGKPADFYGWLQYGCGQEDDICSEEPFKQ